MSVPAFSQIRAVTFDVGGTLIEPWPSVGHIYAETARRVLGEAFDPVRLEERFVAAWRTAHAHPGSFNYSKTAWAAIVRTTFLGLTDRPDDHGLFDALWQRFTEPGAWRIFPDVLPCMRELRSRGLCLAVLSNWDERLMPLLADLGLTQHFEFAIASAEISAHKPDRKIFDHAARQLNLPSANLLHVGDSVREDVAGAVAAGWSAQLLRRGTTEDLETILTLTDLPSRIAVG